MTQPNILFYFVDNLGYGELGCYGGGILRGADTERIDQFAKEGLQLLNFAPEAQCTPSRSALMTGRYSIRSGNHSVPFGRDYGLVAWERTMGDILSEAGYATSILGKWHIGGTEGRWPIDHGFDEMYGPPASYLDAMWEEDPWYDPKRDGVSYFLEGQKGDKIPTEVKRLTVQTKRNAGREYVNRAKDFMQRATDDGKPFFLHFNHPLMHTPTVPGDEYRGSSGNGDWADCLLELDGHFGELLDYLDDLCIADNTIVVFFGDNGPQDQLLHRGTAGYWEGSFFGGSEGALRTPFLIRYPGCVPKRGVSNEIVHIVDVFPTILQWAGCAVPCDREIDGLDQRAFFEGKCEESARDGFIFWNGLTLYGVKWKHFKLLLRSNKYFFDAQEEYAVGRVINLLVDPKEREPINHRYFHSWVQQHTGGILLEFEESLKREPLIPMGAPLEYDPTLSEPEDACGCRCSHQPQPALQLLAGF